jgi:branched-chain amino acid transport system permease protein
MDWATIGAYILTLLVYFVIYNILTWGLNIQFGYAGIPNFTYITFMAIGAYVTGVVGLPKSPQPMYVHYILGLGWPWPTTIILGAIAAAAAGGLMGLLALNRLRSDFYLAIVTFAVGFVAYDFVSTYVPIFNGFDGLAGVEPPFNGAFGLDYNSYPILFLGIALVIMILLWVVANVIYNAPIGRTMRAIRDDVDLAQSLGKNAFKFRMIALVIGCFYAGVGGALTIEFVTAFNPSGWTSPETFVIWAAMLVGGRGNNLGSVLGSFLVPTVLLELTSLIPNDPNHPLEIGGLRYVLIGILIIAILWLRPQGVLPERKRRFYELPPLRREGAVAPR